MEISVIIGVISEIVVDSCELRWRRGHRAESRRDFGFRDLGIEGLRAKSKEQRSEDVVQRSEVGGRLFLTRSKTYVYKGLLKFPSIRGQ